MAAAGALPGAHRPSRVRARARRERPRGDGPHEAHAARLFGAGHPYAERVVAVRGDITRPGLGLRTGAGRARRAGERGRARRGVGVLRARARGLARDQRGGHAAGARVRRALPARRGGLRRFTYISTAYVAGEHAGCFSEDDLDVGQRFRNAYEQSKFEAECLVARARGRLPITVVRPSIVVGERESGWTASFNVLYWPLRAFARGAYAALPARRDAPVDVVPVDYVADAIFALSQAPRGGGRDLPPHRRSAREQRGRARRARERVLRTPGAAPDRPLGVPPRGAPAARSLAAATSATAGRSSAARSSSRTSRRASATTTAAPARRCVARGIAPTPLRTYFDRLVEFALAADWGRRQIPALDAARDAAPRSRPARDDSAPAGQLARAACSDEPRAALGPRRVVPGGGDAHRAHARRLGRRVLARPPTAGCRASRSCAITSSGASRARRATARSSRRSRSGCTRPSGSTTRRSRVDRHVYWAPGPLHELVDEVMSMPLRRDRPLWEMWICEDAEDAAVRRRRQAPPLHGRRHRRGRARLAAARPDARARRLRARGLARRSRSPAQSSCWCEALRDLLGEQLGLLRWPLRAAASPPRARRARPPAARCASPARLSHSLRAAPASVLNRPLSPLRSLAWAQAPAR